MTSALSKRQQARNEKVLHKLVHDVPGNNLCADCHARNPAWASWSLGVFLCMRCAAIHRKLGTHISKVKSLSMDSWSNEQVDVSAPPSGLPDGLSDRGKATRAYPEMQNMRKVGNVVSNQIYNPEGRKPNIPIDADEADSAMERFIRQKYITNVANAQNKPQSPRSDEGIPPPLPPKNSTKFGFKSATSLFPLSSRSKKDTRQPAAFEPGPSTSPNPQGTKPAKVFGATLNYDDPEDTDRKLARLRDMGFNDTQRNAIVLKGVSGNLERAVESLVRLGEGGNRSPAPLSTAAGNSWQAARSASNPQTPSSGGGLGLGLGAAKTSQEQPNTPSSTSNNPFDAMPPAQPQTAHSTGSLPNNNPYNSGGSTNPFGAPRSQEDLFSQAFQSLNLSPQQPLFPHHTGGQVQNQQPVYQHPPMPPSAPTSPQAYQSMGFQHGMTYPQPSPMQPQPTGYNPFLQTPSSPAPPPSPQPQPQPNLAINTNQPQANAGNNPFARSPTRIASPSLGQIPEQTQTTFQSPQPLYANSTGTNPFFNSPVQSPAATAQQPYGQQQYFQPQYFQPQRQDKASIMSLYNQPQASPQQPTASGQFQNSQTPTVPENQTLHPQSFQPGPTPSPVSPARSATLPAMSSNNPFMNSGASPAAAPTAGAADPFAANNKKASRESVNLGMDMAWANGRHSPDAFASLSARHV